MRTSDGVSLVAVVCDHFYPVTMPAEARVNTEVAKALVARGMKLHIWCSAPAELPAAAQLNSTLNVSPGWTLVDVFTCAKRVQALDCARVVLMFDSGSFGRGVWASFLPLLWRTIFRTPASICVHVTNSVPVAFPAWIAKVLRALNRVGWGGVDAVLGGLGWANRLVFYSDEQRDLLTRGGPKLLAKSGVTPAPLTVEARVATSNERVQAKAGFGVAPDEVVILFFGLVYPLKGLEYLLHAQRILIDRGARVRVLIAGGQGGISGNPAWNEVCVAYWDRMQALSEELDLGETCTWMGHVPDDRLAEVFAASDIACFPFTIGIRANNSSFVACAAAGIPVVATADERTDAVFRAPGNGVHLVGRKNAALISDALGALIADPARRADDARGIRSLYEREFGIDKLVDLLVG